MASVGGAQVLEVAGARIRLADKEYAMLVLVPLRKGGTVGEQNIPQLALRCHG